MGKTLDRIEHFIFLRKCKRCEYEYDDLLIDITGGIKLCGNIDMIREFGMPNYCNNYNEFDFCKKYKKKSWKEIILK